MSPAPIGIPGRRAWSAAVVWMAVLLGACTPVGGPPAQLVNLTTEPIAVHVNGRWVGTHAPGTTAGFALGTAEPPIRVEAVSPGGRVLLGVDVTADDLAEIADGGGMSAATELPCGSIEVRIGITNAEPGEPRAAPVGPCS